MKFLKKMTAIVTAATMLAVGNIGILPRDAVKNFMLSVRAADTDIVASGECGAEGDNLTWTLDSEGTLTISGEGEMMDLRYSSEIPWDFYKNDITNIVIENGVTSIGNSAFGSCSSLTSVTIPDSVISIGGEAFWACNRLTSISIPNSVTNIGNKAFSCCDKLSAIDVDDDNEYYTSEEGVLFNKDQTKLLQYPEGKKQKDYSIPNSVTSIGYSAFAYCDSLTLVTIPDSVTNIESEAFSECLNLTSVTIPSSVVELEYDTFNDCISLTSIKIPYNITRIKSNAFFNCRNLRYVYYYGNEDEWNNIIIESGNNILKDSNVKKIYNYNSSEIRIIDSGTCGAQTDNVTWTLDSEGTLTINGEGDIDFSFTSTTSAADSPWGENNDILKVIINEGITRIDLYAFMNCKNITYIKIPKTVSRIGNYAFAECSSLTSIEVDYENEQFSSENGVLFNKEKTVLIQYPAGNTNDKYIIPDSVTSIGDDAFAYCDRLTSISIPNSVTAIGNSAFAYCNSLTSITMPDSATSIGYDAFFGCESLTSIIIPDGITCIENSTFKNCKRLSSITIPDSVTSISSWVFSNCDNLSTIEFLNNVTDIGGWAFEECDSLTTIVLPNNVTCIEMGMFQNCKNLTSVKIHNSVTSIEGYAFKGCNSLTSISIPDSVTSIGDNAFENCTNLTSITIPDSVTSIGNRAFEDCAILSSIDVDTNNENYSSENGVLFDKDKTVLIKYPMGNTADRYVIPNSVIYIENSAFYGCENLTSITMPDSATSIGYGAFWSCESLTSIIIPDSITSIGEAAFEYCENLCDVYYSGTEEEWNAIIISSRNECLKNADLHYDSVSGFVIGTTNNLKWALTDKGRLTIKGSGLMGLDDTAPAPWLEYADIITEVIMEDGVMDIGKSAFEGCTNLTDVTIPNSVSRIEDGAFKNCTALTCLYIPQAVTIIGDDAFYGCIALDDVYYGGIMLDWEKIKGFDDFNVDLSDVKVHTDEIYEHIRFYEDNREFNITGMNDPLIIFMVPEAEDDNAAYMYSMIEDPEKIFGRDKYEQKMVVQMVVTELLCSEELNKDMTHSLLNSMDKAQDNVLKGIKTAKLAGDIIMDDNELQELEHVLAMDTTSQKYKEASEELLKKHLVNMKVEDLKAVLSYTGFALTFTDAIYEDTIQLYNCYLAYQAYSELDQEMKDTLLLLRDKLNKLAIQENDERITALAEEFSTQITRISSEDTSWIKTYAEELIQDDLEGHFADQVKDLAFDYTKKIVAIAMPELSAFLKTADIVLNVGIEIFVAVTKINDRALERDIFLNLYAFQEAAAAVIHEDYGPNLLEKRNKISSKYFECGFQIYKKIRVMLMEHASNYMHLRNKDGYNYWKKQIATNLWECHGSFADYERCLRIADNKIESDIEKNLQAAEKMITSFKSYIINCPVSVIVRNEGIICAELTDEGTIIYEQNKWTDYIVYYSSDHTEHPSKMLTVPKEYEITIVGTDTGTMSFEKAVIENGTVIEISNIEEIPVTAGAVYTEVIEGNKTIALECDLDNDGIVDQTVNAIEEEILLGDVTLDGIINGSDATLTLSAYTIISSGSKSPLNEAQTKAADVDGDGIITGSDATLILRYYTMLSSGTIGGDIPTLEEWLVNQ